MNYLCDLRCFISIDVLPIWHRVPENPEGQLQVNLLMPFMHAPPLMQGLLAHSLLSVHNNMRQKQFNNLYH